MSAPRLPLVRPVAPPLMHFGERERLTDERVELIAELEELPKNSRLRPGLEYRLVKITSRLLVLNQAVDVVMPNRADLQ